MLNYMATMHFLSGDDPVSLLATRHFVHVPYNTFRMHPMAFIVIAVITDNFWQNLKDRWFSCAEFDDAKYDGSARAVGKTGR